MRYSPESLIAFTTAADTGSFSAAARRLRKSQSTISAAIANLESDLGLTLFDRSGHQPQLTSDGHKVLPHIQTILAASDTLDELAVRLSNDIEPHLSFALSDMWKAVHYDPVLHAFAERFPDIEFECLIAEDEDVIDLLLTQRTHMGVLRAQPSYPPELNVARLQVKTEMGLFVRQDHALAQREVITPQLLTTVRQLCLNTYKRNQRPQTQGLFWSAPSFLMLLEMAEQGFGWSILPRWLVAQFGHEVLVELSMAGWPQMIEMDVAWSKKSPPGPAGFWMIDNLLGLRDPITP